MSDIAPTPLHIAGLLLAAGRSRRMGALKQTLPWPSRATSEQSTIIASAFDAIAPFCKRMFIVVGKASGAVEAALGDRRFTRIDADSDDEMFASVRAGLMAITQETMAGRAFDAILLQPGDYPGVASATIGELLHAWRSDPTRAVMPEHRGKGGHPAVVPASIAQHILGWGGQRIGGLRQFWIEHPDCRRRFVVNDPSCILDLDTPTEYQTALEGLKRSSRGF